jgi:hypothetical protein
MMRDWKLPGTTTATHHQQQQQPQLRHHLNGPPTNNNNVGMNVSASSNHATIKSHGVNFSTVSRYHDASTSSTFMQYMSQSCGVGNRSRADSGTSTYSGSSSCDGGEVPLLGQQQKKTRKRSHRPRGCRGGSSRRGANRKTATGQQQQDNNGPPVGTNHNLNTALSDDVPLENMYQYPVYQQSQDQQQTKLAMLPRQPQRQLSLPLGQSLQPTFDNSSNERVSLGYVAACHESFPNAKSSFTRDQNQSIHLQDRIRLDTLNSNKLEPQTSKADFDTSDLNPFADSFDFLPPPSNEICFSYPETISTSLSSSSSSSSSEFILPPLPANALDEESPTVLNGPNPYALNSFVHPSAVSMPPNAIIDESSRPPSDQNKKWNDHVEQRQQQQMARDSANNVEVHIPDHCLYTEAHLNCSVHPQQPKSHVAPIITYQNDFPVPASNDEDDDDNINLSSLESLEYGYSYRSARIERQRQMMAQGGSLFVTSPRSFLLGWRKTTATTAAHPVM